MKRDKNNAAKYQAEVFRLGGYCLCTPLCVKVCSVLVHLNAFYDLLKLLGWDILLLLFIMRGGFTLINIGYKIMMETDKDA